jgi:hypothetical protein
MQRTSLTWLQHVANPLHVYCRLLDLGLGISVSRRIGRFYEKFLYVFLVRSMKN